MMPFCGFKLKLSFCESNDVILQVKMSFCLSFRFHFTLKTSFSGSKDLILRDE